MATRLLALGLDGADCRLLQAASQAGLMPHLQLFGCDKRGRELWTPQGATDDWLWASFQYADAGGGHGRYHWKRDLPGSKQCEICTAGERGLRSFWEVDALAGAAIGILDLPKCQLTRPKRGFHIANWLVHGRYGFDVISYPEGLAKEVESRFGPPPESPCLSVRRDFSQQETDLFVERWSRSIQQKKEAILYYLSRQSFELFLCCFKEIHCSSHLLWHTLPKVWEGAEFAACPLIKVCSALDRALGEILEAVGEPCEVVIFSPSGMALNDSVEHLQSQLVERFNQSYRRGFWGPFTPRPLSLLPYNENALALRLHRWWRKKHAQVAHDLDEVFADFITERGQKVFAPMQQPSVQFSGSRAKRLPDFLFPVNAGVELPEIVTSSRIGTVSAPVPPQRSGNHYGSGFYLARGRVAEILDVPHLSLAGLGPRLVEFLQAPLD